MVARWWCLVPFGAFGCLLVAGSTAMSPPDHHMSPNVTNRHQKPQAAHHKTPTVTNRHQQSPSSHQVSQPDDHMSAIKGSPQFWLPSLCDIWARAPISMGRQGLPISDLCPMRQGGAGNFFLARCHGNGKGRELCVLHARAFAKRQRA